MTLAIPGTLRRRLAGAALAAVIALVAVASAWHDHAFPLEGFHVCAPKAAAPQGHDHDCLACKIAPPFATPGNAPAAVDPVLGAGRTVLPQEPEGRTADLIEPAAPRGPPSLPQA